MWLWNSAVVVSLFHNYYDTMYSSIIVLFYQTGARAGIPSGLQSGRRCGQGLGQDCASEWPRHAGLGVVKLLMIAAYC